MTYLGRRNKPEQPSAVAVGPSLLNSSLAMGTAWLGSELAYRMGVDKGANLNASSSLQQPSAHSLLTGKSDVNGHQVIYLNDGSTISASEV